MSAAHARLSPSGASRWMACPGSVVLEAAYPDKGSVYADEGTAAHTLASYCLDDNMHASEYLGEAILVGERRFPVTDDTVRYVQSYVDLVREYAAGGTLLVEQRVPIGHLTGEEGACGTSDAVVIKGRELIVIDLKYGMGVQVYAEDNPQLQMYALGAYEEFGLLSDFDMVTMVIHQPRLNHVAEWTIPLSQLLAFGEEVRHAAGVVSEAVSVADIGVDSYLNPGEKQCRFCKAKAGCPALKAEVADIVHDTATLDDFADLVPHVPDSQTGDNYLSVAMSKVGLVEDWCKAIRAEVERRLLAGQTVEGYKLVEGKRGNRKWADPANAEALFKSFRMRQDEMYDFSLISPTAAEKVFKENPKRWVKVQEHITRSEGRPSVAPATDKRPALVVQSVADDFSDFLQTDN